ncbi:MAG TPA: energy transducer TonB [Bryobacteraceae bacterium]|nr:energy transducer TonB [Bryobacteraceae bacterium]
MFDEILAQSSARTARPFSVALSFTVQTVLVGLAIVAPVMHPEAIQPGRHLRIVTAPVQQGQTEPPPQHPAVTSRAGGGPRPFSVPVFREPGNVPAQILEIDDASLAETPPVSAAGSALFGSSAGVPFGLGEGAIENLKPPAPKPVQQAIAPRAPMRVGGVVQAAKLMHQVTPVYPPLARQARISGVVRLEAIIDRAGAIRSLQVVSGHPLLVPAAVDAVRQWTYRPTLLNGEPVEVLTEIEVHFKLGD